MKKIYESPQAEVVNFTALEKIASLTRRDDDRRSGNTDIPGTSGGWKPRV